MAESADQRGNIELRVGRRGLGTIPLGVVLAWGWLLASTIPPPVHAGSLYRCVGATGETAYSTTTAGFSKCQKMGGFSAPSPARRQAASLRRSSLTLATGSVVTTARSIQADGALPVSLAGARGNARSTAQTLGAAAVRHASLADVSTTVVTQGRATALSGALTGAEADVQPPAQAVGESAVGASATAAAPDTTLRGAVYRVARADGSVEYTNVRPAGRRAGHAVTMLFTYIATCAACDLRSPIQWGRVPLNLTAYGAVIHAASTAYGVDEALLRAVIHAESAFNPRAMSIKGAQGLMQLMPGTASDLGVLDAFDSEQNIRGGARYLGALLQTFDGDERLAAAAYNAGPAAVTRYGGVPPYAETRVYVQRVATLRKRYAAAIDPTLTTADLQGGTTSRR